MKIKRTPKQRRRLSQMMRWVWSQPDVRDAARLSRSGEINYLLLKRLTARISQWKEEHPCKRRYELEIPRRNWDAALNELTGLVALEGRDGK
jgi:hypothetical protein